MDDDGVPLGNNRQYENADSALTCQFHQDEFQLLSDLRILQQYLGQTLEPLGPAHFGEGPALLRPPNDKLEDALEVEQDQFAVILADVLIEDEEFGVVGEEGEEVEGVEALLVGLVLAEEEQELQVLLAGLHVVLKDEDVARLLQAHPEDPQRLVYLEPLLVVTIENRQHGKGYLDLLELRREAVPDCQGGEGVLLLHDLEEVGGEYDLVVGEAAEQGTESLYDGGVGEVGFALGHDLLAEHGEVVDGVVLDHVEAVLLEPQPVAVRQQVQQPPRSHPDALALPSEDVLHHPHLLQVLVRLVPRGDQGGDELQLGVAVFDLVEDQKVLVEVDQLLVLCLGSQGEDLVQVLALQS